MLVRTDVTCSLAMIFICYVRVTVIKLNPKCCNSLIDNIAIFENA